MLLIIREAADSLRIPHAQRRETPNTTSQTQNKQDARDTKPPMYVPLEHFSCAAVHICENHDEVVVVYNTT